MIRRYEFGQPIDTGAVVRQLPAETAAMPYFTVKVQGDTVSFSTPLQPREMIFGLGETVRGINKRGHVYRSWNSDDCVHTEGKNSLYASHNLLIFSGEGRLFGVYFDDPGLVTFDLAYTRTDEAVITSANGDLNAYIIEEESAAAICRAFRQLTGRSYIPPRWAMGYIQSRWGYNSESDIRTVAAEHRKRHIPLDGMSMDIDYMDRYQDFTWNKETFPDLKQLSADMLEDHLRLVPIIDAGVKEEAGYDTYDEGMARDYFVKKADGKPFIGAVWPGRSLFPDFLKADVRTWFGCQYHKLMENGVEGFWNDMNEPAIFYSEDSLQEAFDAAEKAKGQNLGVNSFFALREVFNSVSNHAEDYRRFYHQLSDGRVVRHDKVHNLYGAFMTRAAAEGFERFNKDKRFLLFSRASFVGSHRYGGVWQGDNSAWWSHLLMNLKMMPSLNMVGYLYTGADLGGFGGDTTPDLMLRWLQLGVFTPLMRNHSAMGTREQEIYRFDNWEAMRDTVAVRYALLPYLYSELMQAALTDGMMFRPLAFDYPEDETACRTEDQVMLGHDAMICPVYEQNAMGRHVYLPEDMLLVRFRSPEDYDLVPAHAGHCWVNLQQNEFAMFIRRGHMIPLAKPAEYAEGVDSTHMTLLGWIDSDVETHAPFYTDDGLTTHPDLQSGLTDIVVTALNNSISVTSSPLILDTDLLIVD